MVKMWTFDFDGVPNWKNRYMETKFEWIEMKWKPASVLKSIPKENILGHPLEGTLE